MTAPINPSALPPACGIKLPDSSRRVGLIAVTTLFFMWGFLTCLNDILIPHLKSVFNLNYVQASAIQFTFFGAYFLMSIPAGKVIAWLGYQRSMVVGLLTAAAGALLFYPASAFLSYGLFLGGLFVLATGTTILQVAANPYIAALGKPETASSRLNLAQAFNSLGTTLAPLFGGWLILAAPVGGVVLGKLAEAAQVQVPYLELAGTLILLAVILFFIKLPPLSEVEEEKSRPGTWRETLMTSHLRLGALGIFLYVGAEVSIGSYLVNFMMDPEVGGLSKSVAASYLSCYWFGAMVGRFMGSGLLQVVRANVLLTINAIIAATLVLIGFLTNGHLAMVSVLAIGLFNSIMFPNIFTLGIAGLGHLTRRGSSILIMAIVGGAIVPVAMGKTADMIGVHHALFIPFLCYVYIIYFGLAGYRQRSISPAL
jgi:FHS family L-fucose permease-like MFS transporter